MDIDKQQQGISTTKFWSIAQKVTNKTTKTHNNSSTTTTSGTMEGEVNRETECKETNEENTVNSDSVKKADPFGELSTSKGSIHRKKVDKTPPTQKPNLNSSPSSNESDESYSPPKKKQRGRKKIPRRKLLKHVAPIDASEVSEENVSTQLLKEKSAKKRPPTYEQSDLYTNLDDATKVSKKKKSPPDEKLPAEKKKAPPDEQSDLYTNLDDATKVSKKKKSPPDEKLPAEKKKAPPDEQSDLYTNLDDAPACIDLLGDEPIVTNYSSGEVLVDTEVEQLRRKARFLEGLVIGQGQGEARPDEVLSTPCKVEEQEGSAATSTVTTQLTKERPGEKKAPPIEQRMTRSQARNSNSGDGSLKDSAFEEKKASLIERRITRSQATNTSSGDGSFEDSDVNTTSKGDKDGDNNKHDAENKALDKDPDETEDEQQYGSDPNESEAFDDNQDDVYKTPNVARSTKKGKPKDDGSDTDEYEPSEIDNDDDEASLESTRFQDSKGENKYPHFSLELDYNKNKKRFNEFDSHFHDEKNLHALGILNSKFARYRMKLIVQDHSNRPKAGTQLLSHSEYINKHGNKKESHMISVNACNALTAEVLQAIQGNRRVWTNYAEGQLKYTDIIEPEHVYSFNKKMPFISGFLKDFLSTKYKYRPVISVRVHNKAKGARYADVPFMNGTSDTEDEANAELNDATIRIVLVTGPKAGTKGYVKGNPFHYLHLKRQLPGDRKKTAPRPSKLLIYPGDIFVYKVSDFNHKPVVHDGAPPPRLLEITLGPEQVSPVVGENEDSDTVMEDDSTGGSS